MPNLSHTLMLSNAAWRAAARLRHPAIDLGLIAAGGPAARLLGENGLSLASARAAAETLASDELARLGIDAAALPMPPRRQLAELDPKVIGELAWADRARTLTEAIAKAPDTLAALATMIDEPSGTVRRLIERDGADPDAVREASLRGEGGRTLVDRVEVDTALLPRRGYALRTQGFVSESPSAIADVLSDPDNLRMWLLPDGVLTPIDGGVEVTVRHRKRAATSRWILTRGPLPQGEQLTWLATTLTEPWAGQNERYCRFMLTEAPGGADVVLTVGYRTYKILGTALGPLIRRVTMLSMPAYLSNLAFVVAQATGQHR